MNFNTLSIIISIAAVLSPIGCSLINNIYSLKLKKYEEQEKLKNTILTEFLNCAADRTTCNLANNMYYRSLSKVLFYINYQDIEFYDTNPNETNLHELSRVISNKITYNNL